MNSFPPVRYGLLDVANFYIRHAYRRGGGPVRRLLQAVARHRCHHDAYGLAIEPYLVDLVGSRG